MYVLSGKEFIDNDRYNAYLSTLNERNREVVEKIVKNTVYISEKELIEALKRCIDKFHSQLKEKGLDKYYLYIPSSLRRVCSVHYILGLVYKYLHPVKILYGHYENTTLEHDYPIVVVDDAIYSSCSTCYMVDTFRHDTGAKPGRNMNTWYFLVAVTSGDDVQVITDFDSVVIADRNMYDMRLNSMNFNQNYMYDNFGCESPFVLPLVFEHAVGNEFASYQFYHLPMGGKEGGILKKKPNRKLIEDITPEKVLQYIADIRLNL